MLHYGAVIAAGAGYDPYGLLAVLQTLSSTNPQDDAVALMFRVECLLPALEEQLDRNAGQPDNAERFAKVMQAYVGRTSKDSNAANVRGNR